MVCPELRSLWAGVEDADSIVFNPHKWLGAQFDCSVQFLANPALQINTLGIKPTYLNTLDQDQPINFSEWTPPLGRRFRALKLWFLLRAYGLDGLRSRIRNHIAWASEAMERLAATPGFTITSPLNLSLFTFRFGDQTEALLKAVNDDGRTYLTQTIHNGQFVIRLQVGQFDCTQQDITTAVNAIIEIAAGLTNQE